MLGIALDASRTRTTDTILTQRVEPPLADQLGPVDRRGRARSPARRRSSSTADAARRSRPAAVEAVAPGRRPGTGRSPATRTVYGFAALRCATDNLNGDNVEFIAYPVGGVNHVFCFAYYVSPAPKPGKIIVDEAPRTRHLPATSRSRRSASTGTSPTRRTTKRRSASSTSSRRAERPDVGVLRSARRAPTGRSRRSAKRWASAAFTPRPAPRRRRPAASASWHHDQRRAGGGRSRRPRHGALHVRQHRPGRPPVGEPRCSARPRWTGSGSSATPGTRSMARSTTSHDQDRGRGRRSRRRPVGHRLDPGNYDVDGDAPAASDAGTWSLENVFCGGGAAEVSSTGGPQRSASWCRAPAARAARSPTASSTRGAISISKDDARRGRHDAVPDPADRGHRGRVRAARDDDRAGRARWMAKGDRHDGDPARPVRDPGDHGLGRRRSRPLARRAHRVRRRAEYERGRAASSCASRPTTPRSTATSSTSSCDIDPAGPGAGPARAARRRRRPRRSPSGGVLPPSAEQPRRAARHQARRRRGGSTLGERVRYRVVVRNRGPATARSVVARRARARRAGHDRPRPHAAREAAGCRAAALLLARQPAAGRSARWSPS